MTCRSARDILSALLDGEPIDDRHALDSHLAGCAECASWRERAIALTEATRAEFSATPDLTVRVLEAARSAQLRDAEQARSAVHGRRRLLRWAVGLAAVVQLGLAIPALLAATGMTDTLAVHASREMASFDIAVAVGFLLAAVRPERARAFVPVACVLATCLAITSLVDMASGLTGLADETGHMVALLQAGLLWALGRTSAATPDVTKPVTT